MTNINFKFSPTTANATLRSHLEKFHADEYVRICREKRWPIMLAKMRQEQSAGASADRGGVQGSNPRPPFSRQTFLHHIINFIVANDQVSLNIYN